MWKIFGEITGMKKNSGIPTDAHEVENVKSEINVSSSRGKSTIIECFNKAIKM